MEYFKGIKTSKGATARYRALAKKWHPDRNGSVNATNVMTEINKQYRETLVRISMRKEQEKALTSKLNPIVDDETGKQHRIPTPSDDLVFKKTQHQRLATIKEASRQVLAILISDYDLDSVGKSAEILLANPATGLVEKGVSIIKRWKSSSETPPSSGD